MRSCLPTLNITHAAAFCSGSSVDCSKPASTELQQSSRDVIMASTSGDLHTDTLADPQTAQVVVAHCGELGDVMLHG